MRVALRSRSWWGKPRGGVDGEGSGELVVVDVGRRAWLELGKEERSEKKRRWIYRVHG